MRVSVRSRGDIPRQLSRRRARMDDDGADAVRGVVRVATAEALARAPVFTGSFVAGVANDTRGLRGSVGSTAPHAHLVEEGRRAGKMPPVAKIAALFGIPLRRAFPLARAIGRGTEGHHVFAEAARATRARIPAEMRRALGRG